MFCLHILHDYWLAGLPAIIPRPKGPITPLTTLTTLLYDYREKISEFYITLSYFFSTKKEDASLGRILFSVK